MGQEGVLSSSGHRRVESRARYRGGNSCLRNSYCGFDGPLIGYAVVGAVTAVTAIGLFIACRFVGSAVSPQPSIHSLRYDNVKEAAKNDLSAQSSAIMASLRQSSIGGAISTTEDVLAKGERITHMASDQMRD